MTLQQKIGQRMAVGFTGTTVGEDLCRLVQTYKVGNVILFRHNLQSAPQAAALCGEIQQLVQRETGHPAFITIDQEGGMVTRLPADMVNVPGAMALAATGDEAAVYEAAALTAEELLRIGVNFNLAPVLDVNSNPANPAIGVRSYGDTPAKTAAYAMQAVRAFGRRGILCAGKHFPGHGDTHLDSHLALPVVNKTLQELERTEFAAFRAAVAGGIPAMMTTHILFPKLEKQEVPATMSRGIITGILKQEMGFAGLVLSDGMEMGAIKEYYGTPQGCVQALAAGVDIVFVCHDETEMEKSLLAIAEAYEAGRFDAAEFDASVEKILRYKKENQQAFMENATQLARQNEAAALAARKSANAALMRRTITLVEETGPLPALGGAPFFAGCLAYRSTIASTPPDTALSFADWFAQNMGGRGLVTPVNPGPQDIVAAVAAAGGASALVVGTYNGHLNRGQVQLANALAAAGAEAGVPVVVVALRNPYDLAMVEAPAVKLAAYEYSENSFKALAAALRGEYVPTGRLGVTL